MSKLPVLWLYQHPTEVEPATVLSRFKSWWRGAHRARHSLFEEFERELSSSPELSFDLQKLSDVQPSRLETLLDKLDWGLSEYEHALALVTFDHRYASEAGNLWFEIGYWLAHKGADKLLILVEQASGVSLPSNLGAYHCPRIKTGAEGLEALEDQVRGWQSGYASSPSVDKAMEKIKATLSGTRDWEEPDFRYCVDEARGPRHSCARIAPTLTMVAELHRASEATREVATLIARLRELSKKSKQLVEQAADPRAVPACVQASFSELDKIVEDLLNDVVSWPRPYPDRWPERRRLKTFLERREVHVRDSSQLMQYLDLIGEGGLASASNWRITGIYDPALDGPVQEGIVAGQGACEKVAEKLSHYVADHWKQIENVFSNHLGRDFSPHQATDRLDACIRGFGHDDSIWALKE